MNIKGNNFLQYLKYLFIFTIIIIIVVILRNNYSDVIISDRKFIMDTVVNIKVSTKKNNTDSAKEQIESVLQEMSLWADKLNRFDRDSIISQINRTNGKWIRVDDGQVYQLIKIAIEYAELTNGKYDPTIAPLMELWGFGGEQQSVPFLQDINRVLKDVNYTRIKFRDKTQEVYLPEGMSLDLGGLAKGFIVDQGIKMFDKLSVKNAYINAGGNIRVTGGKKNNTPWYIGIKNPRSNTIYGKYILSLTGGSIATSGDYERFFIEDNRRYSHLLDPYTGYPAREMYSATIYTDEALFSDVLSTAVFVSGWNKGRDFINETPGVEGFLVRKGEIWLSEGFKKLLR